MPDEETPHGLEPNRRSVLKKIGAASVPASLGMAATSDAAAAADGQQEVWADARLKNADDAVADGNAILKRQEGEALADAMESQTDLQRETEHTLAWDLKPDDEDVKQYNPSLAFLPFAPTAGSRAERAAEVGPGHAGGIIAMVADVDGERVPTAAFGITRTPVKPVGRDGSGADGTVVRERVFSPKDGVTVSADRRKTVEAEVEAEVGDCAFCTALVSTACAFLSTVDDAACLYYCYSLSAVPPAALTCAGMCAALILSSTSQALVCSAGTALTICVGAGYCDL